MNSPTGLLLQHFIGFAKVVDSVYVSGPGPFEWLVKQRARNEIALELSGRNSVRFVAFIVREPTE